MRKPLEMRGWAMKHTAPDGKQKLSTLTFPTRQTARDHLAWWRNQYTEFASGRYTVVPVVVRERR